MAALGTIRKRGALLIGIIGLGLFGFIAGDVFRSCETQSNEARMQVGEVLGKKISVQEFQSLVDEMQEVMKITQGRDNLTENELSNLKDQIWQQYIQTTVLEAEAEKLGLMVTDEEMQNVIKEGTNPVLLSFTPCVNQQTGRFEAAALQEFLNVYKTMNAVENPQQAEQLQMLYNYWTFIEKQLRQNLLSMKYQALLANSILSNPVSAKAAFDGKYIDNDIVLASVAYNTVNDTTVTVTDSDIKAKYEENKERYQTLEEYRDIKYVSYKVTASAADREAIMATMKDAAKKLSEGADAAEVTRNAQSSFSYVGLPMTKNGYPTDIAAVFDTMKVGRTLPPFETRYDNTLNVVKLISKTQAPDSIQYRLIQVGGATMEAAKKTADSIQLALKKGAIFDSLAVKYGNTGEKQWLTSAGIEASAQNMTSQDKKYVETIMSLGKGESKSVEFSGFCLVVQVVDRKANVDKYVAAVVKTPITFSDDTYNAAYNKFSQYVSENQTIEELEKNAAKYGYTVLESKMMSNSVHNVANVSSTRSVLKWIFDEADGVGSVSQLYECGNNDNLMVVALTKIHPKGYLGLDNDFIKEPLRAEVLRDKKFDVVKAQFDGVADIAAAQAKGLQIDTVAGITYASPTYLSKMGVAEAALSGAVYGTEEGKCSPVVKGNAGAYLFQVVKKAPRANQTFNAAAEEAQLQQMGMGNVMGVCMQELISNANVVDNRYLFF